MYLKRRFRLVVFRIIFIVTIAANITVASMVLPRQFAKRKIPTNSIGELGHAYEEKVHDGRGVCILFYDIYRAPNLIVSEEAHESLGFEPSIYQRFCRARHVTMLETNDVPEGVWMGREPAAELQFGHPQRLRTARLLAAEGKVETVYVIVREEIVTFVPLESQDER